MKKKRNAQQELYNVIIIIILLLNGIIKTIIWVEKFSYCYFWFFSIL